MTQIVVKKIVLLIYILCSYESLECFSQDTARILKPELELQGNQVIITYEIENYKENDKFDVWIEITDSNGNPINAKAFIGDIGNRINGGKGKEIIWNFNEDGVSLDAGIYVQIFADPIELSDIDMTVEDGPSIKKVNVTGIVFQSLVFPGIGLSRVTNQPHWLRGVAGYTCIASAIALNRMSNANYSSYKDELDINTRNELFEASSTQDNISEVLVYAAIGIWVTDIIWNIVGSSKLNSLQSGQNRTFSVSPLYEFRAQAPLLAFRYTF